jgi:hypothetical protein
MAVAPSAAPTQAISLGPAPSRAATGSRFSSADQVEGLSGSPFVSLSDQWRAANDAGLGSGPGQGNANQFLRGSGSAIQFTPLVSLAAASYPANSSMQADSAPTALTLTDLQHGVTMYEYYMKVTSGSLRNQGSVVNRYS